VSEVQDSWKEVSSKAEALGLKLKLHLEQEKDETEPRAPGDTKAMVDDFSQKVTDAFESMGNAAKDEAIHADVKEMGRLFKDALMSTFNAVGAEVQNRTGGGSTSDGDADFESHVQDAKVELDDASGDESGDGDA